MPEKFIKNKYCVDVRPDRIDLRDREYLPPLVSLPEEFPDSERVLSILPLYEPLILNQGSEGACTGFGLAAVVNYLLFRLWLETARAGIDDPLPKKVSPRMIYHLARIYDEWPGENYEGSSCRGAMKGWHRHGVCSDELWPYKGKRFINPKPGWIGDAMTRPLGAYYRINKDSVADMQAAIHEVGAIYVSAQVHAGWDIGFSSYPPIIKERAGEKGGHAFAMVGYNPDGFIVQNSWGPGWGFHGFAVLPYSDWVQHGMDAWVAVIGAPVNPKPQAAAIASRSKHSLQAASAGRAQWFFSKDRGTDTFQYKKKEVEPWNETTAYLHAVVLGNDGRPLNRLVGVRDTQSAMDTVSWERPASWLKAEGSNKIAVYVHGGLNDEDASIERVRILAPYFKANGVYPLFITWRTGVKESIVGLVEDGLKRFFMGPRAEGFISDIFDKVKNKLKDVKDRSIEMVCENLLIKSIWTQMKQNAAAAHMGGAGGLRLANNLVKLQKNIRGLELHLIGHSAGGIFLGHFLGPLASRRAKVKSLTLYAPACTSGFANSRYVPAVKKGIIRREDMYFDLLSDEREQADSVGPYGKSLLYLVSRVLEDVHKMPILGMASAWDPSSYRHDVFDKHTKNDVAKWVAFAGGRVNLQIHSQPRVSDGRGEIDIAHGSFDNDIKVMTRTIERITGLEKLPFKIESLRGF